MDYDTDPGLNDLLSDCLERSIDFTRQKTGDLRRLHDARSEYEAELRRVFDGAKHLRTCESAVIQQLSASMPAIELQPEDDYTARIAEHFSPEPSRFLQRLNGG